MKEAAMNKAVTPAKAKAKPAKGSCPECVNYKGVDLCIPARVEKVRKAKMQNPAFVPVDPANCGRFEA